MEGKEMKEFEVLQSLVVKSKNTPITKEEAVMSFDEFIVMIRKWQQQEDVIKFFDCLYNNSHKIVERARNIEKKEYECICDTQTLLQVVKYFTSKVFGVLIFNLDQDHTTYYNSFYIIELINWFYQIFQLKSRGKIYFLSISFHNFNFFILNRRCKRVG